MTSASLHATQPQPGLGMRLTDRFAQVAVAAFGVVMVGFSVIVTIETIGRKFFNLSFQGVDELGGYVLAVTSSLAFSLALLDRAHIRIDLFYRRVPKPLQRLLDAASVLMLASFALLLVYCGWLTIRETLEFRSTAPTPWATPLIWPQGLWFAALVVFGTFSGAACLHAFYLGLTRRWSELDRLYGPKATEEEIREEIADLEGR